MVQILPSIPNFGNQLAQVLTQAAGNLGQGLIQRRNQRLDQNIFSHLASNPEASALQQIQSFSSLSPQSQQTLSPVFGELIKSSGKNIETQREAKREQEDVSGLINGLTDELMEGRTGFFNQFNKLTSKGRASRAYYDEIALGVEKRLVSMVGKGALSKTRFEYLLKNLPSSSDTDATNRGKLRALAKEFKVEIKNPQFKKALGQEDTKVEGGFKNIISPKTGKSVQIPEEEVEAALAAGGTLA